MKKLFYLAAALPIFLIAFFAVLVAHPAHAVPPPGCTLTASPSSASVKVGATTTITLKWTCEPQLQATNWGCSISSAPSSANFSEVGGDSNEVDDPQTDIIQGVVAGSGQISYSAECTDTLDSVTVKSNAVTVTVTPAAAPTGSCSMTGGKTITVNVGSSAPLNIITTCSPSHPPETWFCDPSPVSSPYYSVSGSMVNKGYTETDNDFTITGVKAGTGSFDMSMTCSDGIDSGAAVSNNTVIVNNPAPGATASLSASPTSITKGNSSTLTWSSTNATACTGSWSGSALGPSGTASVSPANTTTYSVTCSGAGGTSAPSTATVTVTAPPPSAGTVTVTSKDSQQLQPVSADWYFPSGPQDLGLTVNQTYAAYANVAAGTYTLCGQISTNCHATQTNLYSLNSVQLLSPSIAQAPSSFTELLSFGKGIFFPDAMAMAGCAQVGSVPANCNAGNAYSQSLLAGKTLDYLILWDPIGALSVNPTTWTPSVTAGGSSVQTNVTVSNSGAPGSSVNSLGAVVNATSTSWLSVSPLSGSLAQGKSDTVTVTVNPSGLTAGTTYTGTVKFSGVSSPGAGSPTQTLTVTITPGVPPAVCGNGKVETGEQCDNGAANGPQAPAACNNKTCQWNPGCTGGTCPAEPVCSTFSANPTTVIVPGATDLNYHCTNVSACTITASDGEYGSGTSTAIMGTIASGSVQAAPGVNTTFTLNCQGLVPGNSNYTTSATVQVDVGTPGRCEQNPNGTGCPSPQ